MNVRRRISAAALAGSAVLGLLAVSACSTSGAAGKEDGKLAVTASFYPMQFLAEKIGGKHVSVTSLTSPGTEPHDLELSPKQTAQLGESDAIVYLKGVQPAVDEAVKQSGVKHTADAASFTTLESHGAEVGGHGHEEHGHAGHDHGDESGLDPHIWLDPVKYAEAAKGVGKTFAAADPAHKADYEKNTAALVKQLDELDQEYKDGLKNRKSDTFITTHAAFGYLAERYGLTEEAISGLDPEATDVSGSRVKELQALAKKHDVHTVFFETLTSPDMAKTLAKDVHAKTDVLDPIEGITKKSRGDDYLSVMESNLKALQKALGAK
ncbi:zinc ABC transporter substrate-binding protein [Streptomyces sp. Ru73]|uniref:metal ABC transporter substrate-binding protein n=1 Tax=Streptomyces sp. Ru73 TaxID=2080748 RepID=UPI000CDE2911|nr:metal ABC transporter substrate-binding protein [Streptomyces sp. Ru73]POX36777.1 zinc ABC transporter substrate-binding protein [Streptomyces sp. Ru73]